MPEGPEVETIRRGLELGITGQEISEVDILSERSFPAPRSLVDQIVRGAKVRHVARRAKVLLIELENDYTLMFHLKMTGQMVLVKADGERFAGGHPTQSMRDTLPDASTRVMFGFASGDKLFFNDFRRFGWIKLVPTEEVEQDPLVSRLGPEVLAPEFTVKAIILDQSTVGGVGNIYVDESLHLARIHPARLGGSLTPDEVMRLHAAVREIIGLGIEHGGTSFSRYVNALGGKGDYLEHARVFRRDGEMCPVHPDTVIEKIRVAGRGTHICPKCQPLSVVD
jgi:formamidopyrimidine-DNA glycosylase